MRKILVVIIALAFTITVVGCATVPMESKLQKTVSMTSMKGLNVREFDSTQRAIWLLWGLIPLSFTSVDEVIGPHVADRGGIQNLKVESKSGLVDTLVTVITQGIITVRTVTISGEVYD